LDAAIPARKIDTNLLVATWNLRAFGGLTDKWIAGLTDEDRPIPKLTLEPTGAAASHDFTGLVHRQLTRQQLSRRISDHLQLWVEFAH
jgi:predicted RNase H-like HicB family nuclease